ncbi:MAG TPA: hypothetical protein VN611_06185 [Patescibacteria group bacterium]|nr:hypothetical protein [Patescibacteria group bacterium]
MSVQTKRLLFVVFVAATVAVASYFYFGRLPGTMSLQLETSEMGIGQVYFDTGEGFNERESVSFHLRPAPETMYTLPLPSKPIRSIRIDPMERPGYFHIQALTLSAGGRSDVWPLAELSTRLQPLTQVEILPAGAEISGLSGRSTGNDPALVTSQAVMIPAWSPGRRLGMAVLIGFVIGGLAYAAAGGRLRRYLNLRSLFDGDVLSRRLLNTALVRSWTQEQAGSGRRQGSVCLRVFTATAVGLVGLTMLTNLLLDPFRIFNTGLLPHDYQVNERYAKIQFLEQTHGQFDSYILGSSRSLSTDPNILEKYIPGSRFYNMGVSGGTTYDHWLHLKYFLAQGYPVRNIYLQLDPEALTDYQFDAGNYLNRHHPRVQEENRLLFCFSYLPILPVEYWKGKIMLNWEGRGDKIFDVTGSGRVIETAWEAQITADPVGYTEQQPSFHQRTMTRTKRATELEKNLRTLREIRDLCQARQIRLIVFMSPPNHVTMDSVVFDDYCQLLRGVSEISPFWDFSGYNSVTLNDRNYYEKSHYRPPVAEMLAARIFDDPTTVLPPDFGVWVTETNVEEHLQRLGREFEQADAAKWEPERLRNRE